MEGISEELASEIGESVEQVVKDSAAGKAAVKTDEHSDDSSRGAAGAVDDDQSGASGDTDTPPGDAAVGDGAITDDVLERAIKAGMPIGEARQYPNAGLLAIAINRMEAAAGGKKDADTDKAGAGEEEVDPLAGIPDLDPDEYDEKIVAGFKALKGLIRQQHDTISELRGNQVKDWFAEQVAGLGDGVVEALKTAPEKRDALKAKFNVLTAGYKAAGQEVDRAEVFKEAASLTLAEEIAAAGKSDRTERAAKRASQSIARPSGNRQQARGDAFDDVAAELDRRFFDKK